MAGEAVLRLETRLRLGELGYAIMGQSHDLGRDVVWNIVLGSWLSKSRRREWILMAI